MLLTIKNATEELKSLSQNGFQECTQHLHSRCQKCIVAGGGYFERNRAYMIVIFVFVVKKVIPRTS
jgi:acetoin utilization deacetylase AcuC-like enzyme